jgi:hypothetical protein
VSTWDIDAAEVGGVLTEVAGHLGEAGGSEGLVGSAESFGLHIELCATEAASGPIGVALSEFAEHHFGLIGDMAALTSSAITGTCEAVIAYEEGQGSMEAQAEAAEHQASAGEIPQLIAYGEDYAV